MVVVAVSIMLMSGCVPKAFQKQNLSSEVVDTKSITKIETLQSDDLLSPEVMEKDFAFLIDRIKEIHPDPMRNLDGRWDKIILETQSHLKKPLTAGEYAIQLMTFISQLKDAHTVINPTNMIMKQLPVKMEWIEGGLVVTESNDKQIHKGDSVIMIGNQSAKDILIYLNRIISAENEYWIKQVGVQFLHFEPFLKGLSAVRNDTVQLTVRRGNEQFGVPIKLTDGRVSSQKQAGHPWFSWNVNLKDKIGYFYIGESKITAEYEEAVNKFFNEVLEKQIGSILIDLRSNSGGDSRVVDPFIQHMPIKYYDDFSGTIKYSNTANRERGYGNKKGKFTGLSSREVNQQQKPIFKGHVYILTGPKTFSSGNQFAVKFRDNNLATIIGEPTGNSPSSFGDIIQTSLPYTKFEVSISHKEFKRPDASLDQKLSLFPDIWMERKKDDLFLDSDGQLKRTFTMIGKLNSK